MSKTTLKRELGLFETTIIGVGIIIGAGIYVLIGKAASLTGPSVWISFVIAGILAAITGLSYAELSSLFPRDSSEYYYVKKAFNSEPLAFLSGWISIIIGVIAASAVALGFAGYFNFVFKTPLIFTALFIVVVLSIVNFMGIRKSTIIDSFFTIASIGGLILITIIGLRNFGSVDYFQTIEGFRGIFKSASLIFFAYIGFESVVRLSEETKNPEKTIPKAIILSIIISTILYIGVALASVSTLSVEQLGNSAAPLAAVISQSIGGFSPILISILAMFATICTILAILLTTSRLLFGMAEEHSLPDSVCSVNPVTKTPGTAVFITGLGALVFILLGKVDLVASIVDFMIYVIFIIINIALIALRYNYPESRRAFKTPVNIGKFPILPPIAIVVSFLMLLQLSLNVLMTSFILIILGALVYEIITKKRKLRKKYMDPYRSACLLISIGLFILGSLILSGGFLAGYFWWTGLLWILLGATLFWYTYVVIFRE